MDENVADEVGEWLISLGFEVFFARNVFAPSTPDEVLAFSSEANGLIIVTHDKDFKQLKRTLPPGFGNRVTNGAGRISLDVTEDRAKRRLEEEWEIVEFHFLQAQKRGQRLMLSISLTRISVITAPSN